MKDHCCESPKEGPTGGFERWIAWLLAGVVLLTLAVRFAEPVRDGDLWWQMAYGRYLAENRTLMVDNSAFSWGPSVKDFIYCAWIPELFLYGVYQTAGLIPLFAFRYCCIGLFLFLLWRHAKRYQVAGHPLTWLISLLAVLISHTAGFIKPEIFSYTLMVLTVWTWWRIKAAGENGCRYIYLLPWWMLIWVNSHGGFIFGAAYLALLFAGELANQLLSPQHALASNLRKHFHAALLLSALAVFLNPYGYRYPLQLVKGIVLGGIDVEGLQNVFDYVSIFHPQAQLLHFREYLLLMAGILLVLLWPQLKARKLDWTIVFTNLAFGWLFTRFLRTTHYWAPIFAFSAINLLALRPRWPWPERKTAARALAAGIVVLCLFLGGRTVFDAVCRPFAHKWFGFGVSYQNPVLEAQFIKEHLSGHRLGNDYNSSGYLLWALWPETKVFYGPQFYTPEKWYSHYDDFLAGKRVAEFMQEYPFEVWCISYWYEATVAQMLKLPDWKLACYGPVAAVFARKDVNVGTAPERVGERFEDIKNLNQALRALGFMLTIKDFNTARLIVAGVKKNFRCPNQKRAVQTSEDLLEGVAAYYRRDYQSAARHLDNCRKLQVMSFDKVLVNAYLHLAGEAYRQGNLEKALNWSELALDVDAENLYALFNVGVIESYLRESVSSAAQSSRSTRAQSCLQKFLGRAKGQPGTPVPVIAMAENIIRGQRPGQPLVLVPPEP